MKKYYSVAALLSDFSHLRINRLAHQRQSRIWRVVVIALMKFISVTRMERLGAKLTPMQKMSLKQRQISPLSTFYWWEWSTWPWTLTLKQRQTFLLDEWLFLWWEWITWPSKLSWLSPVSLHRECDPSGNHLGLHLTGETRFHSQTIVHYELGNLESVCPWDFAQDGVLCSIE